MFGVGIVDLVLDVELSRELYSQSRLAKALSRDQRGGFENGKRGSREADNGLAAKWVYKTLVHLIWLITRYSSRKLIIRARGEQWFKEKFLHVLTPVTITALLITLVLLFSFKGDVIISNPLTILWIAIPLFIQTNLIFWLGYGLSKPLNLTYEDAAPSAMIGASNHFEVAIATATMLFGLSSGAALATVVGVLIEVPVMLMLVIICLGTQSWFPRTA